MINMLVVLLKCKLNTTCEHWGGRVRKVKYLVHVASHPDRKLPRPLLHLLCVSLLTQQRSNVSTNASTTYYVNRDTCNDVTMMSSRVCHMTINNQSPASMKALIAPTCASPLAPPPPRTRPIEVPVSRRARREKSECLKEKREDKKWTSWHSSIYSVVLLVRRLGRSFVILHGRVCERVF